MKKLLKYISIAQIVFLALIAYQPSSYAISTVPEYVTHNESKNKITLRLATQEDAGQILNHFSIIEQDSNDSKKLVILPMEIREMVLQKTIESKRLFVAVDTTGMVLAFTKVHVINPHELGAILKDEIRCFGEHAQLHAGEAFNLNNENQTFVYFGSEYTVPNLRGKGLGLTLVKYALECLIGDIKLLRQREVIMVYGKADGGEGATLPKLAFTHLLHKLTQKQEINFATSIFCARMPVLRFIDGEIVDARAGQPLTDHGFVLAAKLDAPEAL